jgi:hypothetical protein
MVSSMIPNSRPAADPVDSFSANHLLKRLRAHPDRPGTWLYRETLPLNGV